MRRLNELKTGCVFSGVTHQDNCIPDVDTKVAMVKAAGTFDYIDRCPPDDEFRDLLKASEKHGVPVLAGGWFYTLGRDEALLERNIHKARLLGSGAHNVQVMTCHADGHVLSNEEVADFYLHCHALAMRHDVVPCFEVHTNMWSEHPGRVEEVAALVERRGLPFLITLDHSHVIFKIDNPVEQLVQGLKADVDAGRCILDPRSPDSVTQRWIDADRVLHCHARAAVPANPVNIWAKHPDGRYGRGIQYPFLAPGPGEFPAPWNEDFLEPWKHVVRELLNRHARCATSRLRHISTEFIVGTDYGAGHKYSTFDNNMACARWIRDEWALACAKVSADTAGVAHA